MVGKMERWICERRGKSGQKYLWHTNWKSSRNASPAEAWLSVCNVVVDLIRYFFFSISFALALARQFSPFQSLYLTLDGCLPYIGWDLVRMSANAYAFFSLYIWCILCVLFSIFFSLKSYFLSSGFDIVLLKHRRLFIYFCCCWCCCYFFFSHLREFRCVPKHYSRTRFDSGVRMCRIQFVWSFIFRLTWNEKHFSMPLLLCQELTTNHIHLKWVETEAGDKIYERFFALCKC